MSLSEQVRNESYHSEGPKLSRRQAEVLEYVRSCGFSGATRREIAEGTGLAINVVCGRVVELRKAGHVSEERMTRLADTGKVNSVLVAKEFDRGELLGTLPQAGREGADVKADAGAGTGDPGRTEGSDEQIAGREVQCFLFSGDCD
jgi:hypothetical protein